MGAGIGRVVPFLIQFVSFEVSVDGVQAHVSRDCWKYEDRQTITVTRAQTDEILRDNTNQVGRLLIAAC